MNQKRFATYAWIVLGYMLLVIMFGAFVRATGAGAGCGSHWPLCNGDIIPRPERIETAIEFTHRITSAISGILVLIMLFWGFRAFPKGHPVRLGAVLSTFFVITEGLVGAGLVLFELVAHNASVARTVSIAAHLINTFLLLASLTLTGWWGRGGGRLRLRDQGTVGWLLALSFVAMLILGATGAITALGDTLFPAGSLAEGLSQDFDANAHFLVRLRVWHPVVAVATGIFLWYASSVIARRRASDNTRRFANLIKGLFVIQLLAGFINVLLLAPVWMQLLHLLLADLVWIALVLLAAAALDRALAPSAEPAVLVSQPGD